MREAAVSAQGPGQGGGPFVEDGVGRQLETRQRRVGGQRGTERRGPGWVQRGEEEQWEAQGKNERAEARRQDGQGGAGAVEEEGTGVEVPRALVPFRKAPANSTQGPSPFHGRMNLCNLHR